MQTAEYMILRCGGTDGGVDCDSDGKPLSRYDARVRAIQVARRRWSEQADTVLMPNSRLTLKSLTTKAAYVSQALADVGFEVLTQAEEKAVEYRAVDGTE